MSSQTRSRLLRKSRASKGGGALAHKLICCIASVALAGMMLPTSAFAVASKKLAESDVSAASVETQAAAEQNAPSESSAESASSAAAADEEASSSGKTAATEESSEQKASAADETESKAEEAAAEGAAESEEPAEAESVALSAQALTAQDGTETTDPRLSEFALSGVTASITDPESYAWVYYDYDPTATDDTAATSQNDGKFAEKALKSSNQNVGSSNSIMTITFSSDEYFNLSFKYGASAEKQWDYLTIKIDGEQVATTKDYSGSNGDLHTGTYTTSTPLSDGEHTLVVDFYNDYSGFNGSDCGYLYDIVASAVYDPAAVVTTTENLEQGVQEGTAMPFTVDASKTAAGTAIDTTKVTDIAYQWYSKVGSAEAAVISGQTQSTLSYNVPSGSAGDEIQVYCVVSYNLDGSATTTTSNTISFNATSATAAATPTITSISPASSEVNWKATEPTLTCTASVTGEGAGTLSYQWYSNAENLTTGGTAIEGATASTYEAPTATVGTVYYYCVVTNTFEVVKTASATSDVVSVTTKADSILNDQATALLKSGSNLAFSTTDTTAWSVEAKGDGDASDYLKVASGKTSADLVTSVTGPGWLIFQWEFNSTSSNWQDHLYCYVDGEQVESISGGSTNNRVWATVVVPVTGDGTHQISFSAADNHGCASLDEVRFVTEQTSVTANAADEHLTAAAKVGDSAETAVDPGTSVEFTATPASGYFFDGWKAQTADDNYASTANPYTVTVYDEPLTFTGYVSKPFEGSGTEADPFQIASETDLGKLATYVNQGTSFEGQYFTLMNDIALENAPTVIGDSWSHYFKGTFDGNDKTISGLIADHGLFGYASGTIEDLTVNAMVTATTGTAVGILVGQYTAASSTSISNCTVAGFISMSANSYVGGVVGYLSSGSITSCTCEATVTSTNTSSTYGVGGIAAQAGYNTQISGCSVTGNVTASSLDSVGGVVGVAGTDTTCSDNTITANVAGKRYVGGIVGKSSGSSIITENTYSGAVSGGEQVGGILGCGDSANGLSVTGNTASGTVAATNSDPYKDAAGGIVGYAQPSYSGSGSVSGNYALQTAITNAKSDTTYTHRIIGQKAAPSWGSAEITLSGNYARKAMTINGTAVAAADKGADTVNGADLGIESALKDGSVLVITSDDYSKWASATDAEDADHSEYAQGSYQCSATVTIPSAGYLIYEWKIDPSENAVSTPRLPRRTTTTMARRMFAARRTPTPRAKSTCRGTVRAMGNGKPSSSTSPRRV